MRSNPAHRAANSVRITINIIGKRRRDGFIGAKSSLKRMALCCEIAKGTGVEDLTGLHKRRNIRKP
jgi:hypothetical protein